MTSPRHAVPRFVALTALAFLMVVPFVAVATILRRLAGLKAHPQWTLRHEIVFLSQHLMSQGGVGASIRFIRYAMPLPPRLWAPPGGRLRHTTVGGRPAEVTTPSRWSEGGPTILYLHGGGYGACSPATHRTIVSTLTGVTGFRAVSLDYRLAPEHPHPAAVEDAWAAWQELCAESDGPLFVAGDSAGGGLTLVLLLKILREGGRQPTAAAAISPWTDLTMSGPTYGAYAHLDYLPYPQVKAFAEAYVGDADPREPLISPAYGDFTGACPVLVQYGEAEVLRWDAEEVVRKLTADGVDVKADPWPGMTHVFQGFQPFVPEAQWALRRMGRWLMERAERAKRAE